MCIYFVVNMCAGRIELGWAHDVFTIAYHMFMHFHAYVLYILYILIYWTILGLFWLSLSPPSPHSLVYVNASWYLNVSLFHSKTLFVPRHPLLLTPLHLLFGSMMRTPERTSRRTFLDEAFIRNAKSFFWTSPTLTYPLSFTVEVRNHYVTSQSLVHQCWSRSSTPTCMDLIIQYLFLLLTFKVRALWSHQMLYLVCSVSRRYSILITPVVIVWGLCLKTSLFPLFLIIHPFGVIISLLLVRPLLKALIFLIWPWL